MKRAHNPPKAAHKAHKRQKLDKAPKPATKKQKRRVQLNDLGWKTVGMPDRLEDTEGFYGLEEIDDVEVIKDTTTGNITFQTTKTEEEVANDVEAAWKREEEEAARLEKMIGQEGKELPPIRRGQRRTAASRSRTSTRTVRSPTVEHFQKTRQRRRRRHQRLRRRRRQRPKQEDRKS
jgi:hypothetical protein